MNIDCIERVPTVSECLTLRHSVGWHGLSVIATETSLAHSLYAVCAQQESVVVGCGRIVGGDGINFYIQDLIIRPEYQHRGMGTQIMKKLMDYIGRHAQDGAQIGLMAAEGLGACSRIEKLLRKSPFGPLSRSFPLNRACYWPQMIKKMDSKWLPLATASILGQAPRGFLHALWFHPFS